MMRVVWLLLLAVALGLFAPASADDPKPDPKKQKALADLLGKLKEKRAGGTQGYKMEFERTGFKQGMPGPPCRVVKEFQIDSKTGKFRLTGWDGCSPFKPFEQIEVYDGERIKTQFRDVTADGKPTGDGSWKYGMNTGRMNSRTFRGEYWPLFLEKGVIVGLNDQYYPGHFVFDVNAEEFFVDGEVERDGSKCISLKTFTVRTMQYEYLIDPKKDNSVVGFLYSRESAPVYSLDVKVAEDKQSGRWRPSEWTYVVWGPNANAEWITKVKATRFAEDAPKGEKDPYNIVYPEGAKVGRSHYELPKGKTEQTVNFYQYEVKNGKLVLVSGPTKP